MRIASSRGLTLFALVLSVFLGLPLAYGQDSNLIRVKGSNLMAGMCNAWAVEFTQRNPSVRVHVTGGGTAAGLESLFEKTVDVAMASRRMIEKEYQAAALGDVKPAEVEVARTGIAIVTHPMNTVNELTLDQLTAMLTGSSTRWSQADKPEDAIFLIVSPPDSGTSIFLKDRLFPGDYFSSDANVRSFFHDILKEISVKKPLALGYAGMFDAMKAAEAGRVKIVALKKDENSPAVIPSPETVKSGTYPLVMQLYFYWDRDKTPEYLRKFIDFCRTKGANAS